MRRACTRPPLAGRDVIGGRPRRATCARKPGKCLYALTLDGRPARLRGHARALRLAGELVRRWRRTRALEEASGGPPRSARLRSPPRPHVEASAAGGTTAPSAQQLLGGRPLTAALLGTGSLASRPGWVMTWRSSTAGLVWDRIAGAAHVTGLGNVDPRGCRRVPSLRSFSAHGIVGNSLGLARGRGRGRDSAPGPVGNSTRAWPGSPSPVGSTRWARRPAESGAVVRGRLSRSSTPVRRHAARPHSSAGERRPFRATERALNRITISAITASSIAIPVALDVVLDYLRPRIQSLATVPYKIINASIAYV